MGPDCTLDELALELAIAEPGVLSSPAIGTRLVFQLIFPDLRNATAAVNAPPRFASRDLGSVVIGSGGPGVEEPVRDGVDDGAKKLSDARFVVGDYVTCAVLPPQADGSVVPASVVRRESASMGGRDRGARGDFPRDGGRGGRWDARRDGRGGHGGGFFPHGEWKRGEQVPTGPGGRRGDNRW